MIQTTSGFSAANARMAKTPIYALSIAGQATVWTTHDLARMGVTGIDAVAYEPWLKTPAGAGQSIDVINGSSSIGELACEVIDPTGAVLTLIGTANPPLEGQTATLTVGYPGTAWTDFAVLHTYQVCKIAPSDGYTSYVFTCRDPQLLTLRTIYLHPENGDVLSDQNPWYLCGTPCEVAQAVMLFALGLAADQVDTATMAALDSPAEMIFANWRPFQFAMTTSFEAKQFLEAEVYKPSGLYPVVTPDGRLSLRSMRPPAAGPVPVFTFTESNLVEFPRWDRQPVINEAVWDFDYDGSNYVNRDTFAQATSMSYYLRGQQFSISSKGLRTELGAFAFAEWMTSRLFRRFAGVAPGIRGGAPLLTVRAMLMSLPVWVGDYAALTHTKMPDLTTGVRGVTDRIYEVVDRQPDFVNGQMQYRLLDTGLTGQPAASVMGTAEMGTAVIY
jgi:hypothetical protein